MLKGVNHSQSLQRIIIDSVVPLHSSEHFSVHQLIVLVFLACKSVLVRAQQPFKRTSADKLTARYKPIIKKTDKVSAKRVTIIEHLGAKVPDIFRFFSGGGGDRSRAIIRLKSGHQKQLQINSNVVLCSRMYINTVGNCLLSHNK